MSSRPGGKGLSLFGHPVHTALVHLPLGLFLAAGIVDALALVRPEPFWWAWAYGSLGLGLLATVPAAVTGFLDFLALPRDAPSEKVALRHMLWMMTAATLMLGSWFLHRGALAGAPAQPLWAAVTTFAGCAVLAVGGFLGGEMVYRHGVGVERAGPSAGER